MSDRSIPPAERPANPTAAASETPTTARTPRADAMLCDRCQAEMFRMHAVWRCPACGFKTDCCGW